MNECKEDDVFDVYVLFCYCYRFGLCVLVCCCLTFNTFLLSYFHFQVQFLI